MDTKITYEGFVKFISKRFNVSIDKITKETSFINDLGMDSLSTYALIGDIENEFNIKMNVELDDLMEISTIGQAYDFFK
ncbi:acyl carrier protein [Clostridium sp. DJ247]|uniref:acyl carrier protein n=1 Tax=Clostridium sp. DJ247 TaxID=2726188 RepID=UPI001628E481|nr:acyl carrier protein [Clostridium sp. DJ247]MBC2580395.1 acyl carrier protein [Clostridium sp. DJ247]